MKLVKELTDYILKNIDVGYSDNANETLIELNYKELESNGFGEIFSKNFLNIWKKIETTVGKELNKKVCIVITDYPASHDLKELDSQHIGKFIRTKCMIKNITPIRFRLKEAVMECDACKKLYHLNLEDGKPPLMSKCTECGGTRFTIVKDMSLYENHRYLKIEEPLEMREGGDSREFMAEIKGFLASPNYQLKPGDVCEVAGEFDVVHDEKKGVITPLFRLWHIKPLNNNYRNIRLSDEDIMKIYGLRDSGDAYKKFVESIAPQVYGYETIKKGVVLQMFGGNQSDNTDFSDRSVLHILLIGDPGVGKSKLIESIHQTAPKAIRANGAGTSQSGLTATAVKDELTGSWTLEAGGIVLADGGILTIDEFDKLPKIVMKTLNEPMEQLSVSVAKAGLVQTMSARTSILAGANPKYGRFDKYKTIAEQLDIPSSTISRFDLIFVIGDKINLENDLSLSKKILKKEYDDSEDLLSVEFMKKYINFARMNYNPVFTDEAINTISEFYAKTRQLANNDEIGKPITLREMGAISRLSISKARLELHDIVSKEDAEEAIQIYSKSLESLGLSLVEAGEIQEVYSQSEIKAIDYCEDKIREQIDISEPLNKEFKEEVILDLITGYRLSDTKANKIYELAKDNVFKEE